MRQPAATLLPFLLLAPNTLRAQQTPTHITHVPPDAAGPRSTSLPVTRISLYKNGVGYFEHTGFVSGNASVNLDFTSGQLDDVLQSLTAIDLGGGRISGAGYNSTTPLDQQLKGLSLGLTADPSDVDFYTAIRGARVQVTGSGPAFTGRLLSIDLRELNVKSGSDSPAQAEPTQSHRFITVVSDAGTTRTLELTAAVSVTLLDTALHTDVTRYLELIAANRNQGLRHLTLLDLAPAHPTTAQRTLQLSYISEVPIWKSTYRILFTDPGTKSGAPGLASETWASTGSSTSTATLQGWSVVDNTTGIDWINVHLSLIAGAPQSFIQPLSQPIYSRRPEIPIAQEAQLSPQTHDSGLINAQDMATLSTRGRDVSEMIKVQPGFAMKAKGQPGGVMGGIAGGSGSGIGSFAPVSASATTLDGISYENAATASISPSATSTAFDDFFAYNITEPVTIRKNESALVPILQAKVTAERVSLVSSNGFTTSQPLRALWLTNTSGLTLDRGSFTLIENGSFGGEGLLDPIHAGEKRLLSYAADQAVHVTMEGQNTTSHIDRVTADKGVLMLQNAEAHEITYVVHNSAADARTVVLEQPVVRGFVLDSTLTGNADPKPDETTSTVYRFRLLVAPGGTVRLHTGARRRGTTTYQLTNSNENQLTFILKQANDDPRLAAALQPILDARRHVADAQTAVDQTNTTLKNLRADEDRQRSNITALATADKSSRDRFVHDLNKTEDAINAAQAELTTRTTALEAAKADLSNRIESLQIDDKL